MKIPKNCFLFFFWYRLIVQDLGRRIKLVVRADVGIGAQLRSVEDVEPLEGADIACSKLALSPSSPTACLLRGYGRTGTQNDPLGEAVIFSTGMSIPAQ